MTEVLATIWLVWGSGVIVNVALGIWYWRHVGRSGRIVGIGLAAFGWVTIWSWWVNLEPARTEWVAREHVTQPGEFEFIFRKVNKQV